MMDSSEVEPFLRAAHELGPDGIPALAERLASAVAVVPAQKQPTIRGRGQRPDRMPFFLTDAASASDRFICSFVMTWFILTLFGLGPAYVVFALHGAPANANVVPLLLDLWAAGTIATVVGSVAAR